MSEILPIAANKTYIQELKRLARELNITPAKKEEYALICKCFMAGWQASKDHTFQILKSIDTDGDKNGK